MTHRTKDNKVMLISEMKDSHLINNINRLERNYKKGYVMYDGGGHEVNDMYYDEEEVSGVSYLKEMNYKHYIIEALKRKLLTSEDALIKLLNILF